MNKIPYVHPTDHGPRQTSRGIVVKDGQILLMERWRDGLHYFAVPGGGIDQGETAEAAAVREIKEETSLDVEIGRLVYEMHDSDGHTHYFYLCRYVAGDPYLPESSEEAQHGKVNRFKPQWVSVDELGNIEFNYWEPIRAQLIEDLKNGFSKKVKITAV